MMYWQMIRNGGPMMVVIVICALIAAFLFLSKYLQLRHLQ